MYAKLIDGTISPAPRVLVRGGQRIYNPPAEVLAAAGWKLVVYTDAPEVEAGFAAAAGWTETAEVIVQTWTVEPEGDIPDAEALEILLGGEGA